MNFSLPTVSLLSHLQILHPTFNAILPNCPASCSQSLSRSSSCLYRINLFSPASHSHAQGAPSTGMCGAADFGGSFSAAAGNRQEKENKQVQELEKNELVEARGGKQWQVNTAEQEEKDVYVCLFKVCSGGNCKSARTVSPLTML